MLPNDIAQTYPGGTVPTIIADVAGAATAIYGSVTGRPVPLTTTVTTPTIVAQQRPQSGGLLTLVVIGLVAFLLLRK